MIFDPAHYVQSQWLNGKGLTTQLLIHPEGHDFKLQQFSYRMSIASLSRDKSAFSMFEQYQRWLVLLQGGPVHIRNKTTEV
jgi:environmental stress-induced protein Ves